ncbi:MAG: DUF4350 domain-containing protein [bacterium]
MRRTISIIILILLVLFFLVSASSIMHRRMEKGDVYPRYSSLRHDPMGTSILFDSLRKSGCTIEVLTEDEFPEVLDPRDTILFILFPTFDLFSNRDVDRIVGFILSGGRVLITTDDDNSLMDFFHTGIGIHDTRKEKGEDEGTEEEEENETPRIREAIPGTGFDFSPDSIPLIREQYLTSGWPRAVTVLGSGEHDVVLLLSHGKGDIIISSEPYLISNESLAKDPPAVFLSWVMGGRTHVLVDEYRHGVLSNRGVSFLLRKYHLYWLIGYLAILFLLGLWYLLPHFRRPLPRESVPDNGTRSSLDGYTQLLTKTIPRKQLLDIAMEQWLKGSTNRFFREKNREAAEGLRGYLPQGDVQKDEEVIAAYNEIAQRLKERRRFR